MSVVDPGEFERLVENLVLAERRACRPAATQHDGCEARHCRQALLAYHRGVVEERDNAVGNVQDLCEKWQADLDGRIRAEAERDAAVLQLTNRDCQIIALKATVERVRALPTDGFDQNAAYSYVLRDNLDRALAEPEVQDTSPFYYCELKKTVGCNGTAGPHGFGKCVERRGAQRRKV